MAAKPTAPSTELDAIEAQVDAMMDLEYKPEPSPVAAPVLSAPTLPPERPSKIITEPLIETLPSAKPVQSVDSEPVVHDIEVKPLAIDTAQSDAAIADIVAQEADEVLAAEDAGLAAANESVTESPKRRGHPFFWFLVVLIAIVAIIAAVILVNPNLQLPFSR